MRTVSFMEGIYLCVFCKERCVVPLLKHGDFFTQPWTVFYVILSYMEPGMYTNDIKFKYEQSLLHLMLLLGEFP